MIERIIEFSARNRFMVLIMTVVLGLAGWFSLKKIPIDAIPDLSDTQVIIYSKWDRSPDIIEDQVTYPIIAALLGAPKVKDIRGFSDFGFSYVYVIFEDGVDPYWARSRVLEYLSKIQQQLPDDVQTEMGPDATGIGWVFQYALVDKSGKHSLADLRSYQDWFLRYVLQTVPGVAEVASVGGFQKQYQVKINPNALLAYKIPIERVVKAIKESNNDVGARMLEVSGAEYMIRGKGYIKNLKDIESIVLGYEKGTPIYIKNVALVTLGPEIRRGVTDLDGEGDAVGGIVVMRYGENAMTVIEGVKEKLRTVALPKGVELVVTYDRSDLIERAIETLKHELFLEMLVVSIVVIVFLLHIPSAFIPIVTLPLAALMSFIPMYYLDISSNIMSLGGIAIAIGAMVDASIVVIENSHKHLEEWERGGRKEDPKEVVITAIKEVGPASFYSLLVIAVAFLPIFALEAEEGKLFKPLAYTKNFSMVIAAILAITLVPALRVTFTQFSEKHYRPRWFSKVRNAILVGKNYSEEDHPVSKFLFKIYGPLVNWVIEHRFKTIIFALIAFLATIPVYLQIGSEFMPPLNEGTILYMPTTMPGMSAESARDLLQRQDIILKSFPEVERVFGKAGRADTSTDSAPFSMVETTIILKHQDHWRKKERWYSFMPEFMQWPFTSIWPNTISWEELISKMDQKMKFPGTTNAWTMPIRTRIDMLATGIRTPVGIKVLGSNLQEVERVAIDLEKVISKVEGTRSVFAERISGGYFLDFNFDREKLARYGLSIEQAQMTLMSAVGGEPVTKTIEGRERYTVNVRYFRDYRSNIDSLKRVLIGTPDGKQIPMGQVANIEMVQGPSMIRNENGLLSSFVYVDVADRDIGSYVKDAKKLVEGQYELPPGINLSWSGQYENMERVKEKLKVIVPITLFIIIFLIYMNTQSWTKTGIVLLAVPFSAIGAFWTLYLLDYNMSIGVWVGLLALLGLDAETGVFMLLYLDLAYDKAVKEDKMNSFSDLKHAVYQGAVKRVRPKFMTVGTDFMMLLPIMMASTSQAGADVMKRIAAPMFGGVITSFALELLVYPAIYTIWKWNFKHKKEFELKRKAIEA